jgi:hypothetical protein
VHVIATENCCCIKAAIDFWRFPAANLVRNKSARLETRFVWMQSVIRCTHYVAGASEQDYVNKADAPEVKFVRRDEISDSGKSYTEG